MKAYLCHYCGEINALDCLECRNWHRANKAPKQAEIVRISKAIAKQVGLGKARTT